MYFLSSPFFKNANNKQFFWLDPSLVSHKVVELVVDFPAHLYAWHAIPYYYNVVKSCLFWGLVMRQC